jgi:tetratricopeptide (TPR) repeat protein
MPLVRLVLGVLLAVLATSQMACVVGPRFTKCPGQGGRGWVQLESDHYTLRTDLPPEEARRAMSHLERTRVAMLAAMWPGALRREMTKLSVYVLQDPREFEGLYPRRVRAFFFKSDTEALIVLPGGPESWEYRFSGLSEASSSRLNHELAHFLSTYALARQPRWLSEGLAEYLETLRLSKDGSTAVVGTPNPASIYEMAGILDAVVDNPGLLKRDPARAWSMQQRVLAWDRMQESGEEDRQIAYLYAGSWLLVHWLLNERPEAFARYLALMNEGVAPEAALRQALPGMESPALDSALLNYLRNRRYRERTVPVPPVGTGFIETVLEDAEVHAIRSKLAELGARLAWREPFITNRKKLAKAELDESLRLNPKGLPALTMQLRSASESERPDLARVAVEAHPEENEAWLLRASTQAEDPAAQEASYKKALELEPKSFYAATGLAWLYVTQGRIPEALPLAQWAVQLAPWSTYALDTYALALAGGGACDEALRMEERALELISEDGDPELERILRERIEGLTRGELCTRAAP